MRFGRQRARALRFSEPTELTVESLLWAGGPLSLPRELRATGGPQRLRVSASGAQHAGASLQHGVHGLGDGKERVSAGRGGAGA